MIFKSCKYNNLYILQENTISVFYFQISSMIQYVMLLAISL